MGEAVDREGGGGDKKKEHDWWVCTKSGINERERMRLTFMVTAF